MCSLPMFERWLDFSHHHPAPTSFAIAIKRCVWHDFTLFDTLEQFGLANWTDLLMAQKECSFQEVPVSRHGFPFRKKRFRRDDADTGEYRNLLSPKCYTTALLKSSKNLPFVNNFRKHYFVFQPQLSPFDSCFWQQKMLPHLTHPY